MVQPHRPRPRSRTAGGRFPDPHHDHAACAAGALEVAEAICAVRGEKMTALRRRVLFWDPSEKARQTGPAV